MSTVEIKNLSKSFGKNQALSDVTLTLKENCIYGLLGRNGAGKSTQSLLPIKILKYK